MKFAIVDLGSNTIRLSVYNTLPEGGFDLLFSEKEMAGLVSYVHGGVLSPEGIQRACGAIRDFQALLRQFDLDAPHVFATASLRNIRNTEEAVEQIRAATGVGVDVISGELEARLGYYGARTATDLQDGAMFDIGGGSAEVLEVRAGEENTLETRAREDAWAGERYDNSEYRERLNKIQKGRKNV